MAKRSLSSLKRVRQNERRRIRNLERRSALKSQIRKARDTIAKGGTDAAQKVFRLTAAALDKAAAAGVIHRKAASRKKSRLAKRVNTLKPARK
ncbi:MAG: 30S ribosomal protein S20 [Phycisphaerae bacterium]|nr:30S ribosomal protein S20 [Phycisphaerae bacterium]